MNAILMRWNGLETAVAAEEVLPCCGSRAWAEGLAALRPFDGEGGLFAASDAVWAALPVAAWQQAFDSHPRIGQAHAQKVATAESLRWSAQEQRAAVSADEDAKLALAAANARYEERFGRIFIVCAAGRSASEILALLEARMHNDDAAELDEAAEQQRQITQLRLRRWLRGE
jgi:2-oxo-4-hydroxy-4-carboxy-5-ureidoimidazoline decarboxylase